MSCKNDQILFEKTYLPMVCEKPNAPYHLTLINAIADTILHGGKQAILLPRGGAKTTKCRAGFLHGGLYGRIRWGYNISANEDKALETLETLKTWLQSSPLLLEDFPEICFPISILKTKHTGSVAESQSYCGTPTRVVWARDEGRNVPGRNVRLRMGLPPVATNPLEQSLRSWLCARFRKRKPVSATRHGPFLTER